MPPTHHHHPAAAGSTGSRRRRRRRRSTGTPRASPNAPLPSKRKAVITTASQPSDKETSIMATSKIKSETKNKKRQQLCSPAHHRAPRQLFADPAGWRVPWSQGCNALLTPAHSPEENRNFSGTHEAAVWSTRFPLCLKSLRRTFESDKCQVPAPPRRRLIWSAYPAHDDRAHAYERFLEGALISGVASWMPSLW